MSPGVFKNYPEHSVTTSCNISSVKKSFTLRLHPLCNFLSNDTLLEKSVSIALKYPRYVGPCHRGMARLRDACTGDGLQIWRVKVK